MYGIKGYQFHLLHIRFAIFGQILFVTEDIDDFCNEIIASLAFVYLLLHPNSSVIGNSLNTGALTLGAFSTVHPAFSILSGVFLPLAIPT